MQRNLGLLVGAMADELESWLEVQASSAAQLLRSCAWLAEDGMANHLGPLLLPICRVSPQGVAPARKHAGACV